MIIILVFRRMLRGGGSSSVLTMPGMGAPVRSGGAPGAMRTRVVEDGFWIEGDLPAGGRVNCRYTASGQPHQIEVELEGKLDGQFVYTGARPSNVSTVIIPGSGRGAAAPPPPIVPPPMTEPDFPDRPRRGRYSGPPPAY